MKIKAPDGKTVEADKIDILDAKEQWSSYKLADGTTLRVKPVVVSVVHLKGCYNDDGEPLYQVRTENVVEQSVRLDPRELMKLPRDERRRILAQAAAEAEEEYRNNAELTDFDAFGDGDLHDETS